MRGSPLNLREELSEASKREVRKGSSFIIARLSTDLIKDFSLLNEVEEARQWATKKIEFF